MDKKIAGQVWRVIIRCMKFLKGERLILVIAVLAVAFVFFYPNFFKILIPGKETKFNTQNNFNTIPTEFPPELLFDLEEVKDSKTADYINKGAVTAKQREVTYISSRPFAELVSSVESFFVVNGFDPIYKEASADGKIQTRRSQKTGESLIIQVQKIDSGTSEVRVIYTK